MMKDSNFLPGSKKITEKKEEPKMEVLVVDDFDEKSLNEILAVDESSFPEGWQYEDAKEYYREMIKKKENINIVLREGEKITGYLLAIPYSEAYNELKEDDPGMKEDKSGYYVETMAISPESRGKEMGFMKITKKIVEEILKNGKDKLIIHVRVSNRLNEVAKKIFKDKVVESRIIENWKYYNYEEPTEYIEVDLRK